MTGHVSESGGQLRGVLVGCGHASRFHLAGWKAVPGCVIVAVADHVPERAERRRKQFRLKTAYRDLTAMLNIERPDFVDIATRPDSHMNLVRLAATSRTAVLCQKPVAGTISELRAMISLCEDNGVPFVVNENFRFQPWCRKLGSLLRAGAIGRVHHLAVTTRAQLTMPSPQFLEQPYFDEMDRLLIYEFGVHMLDVTRYLLGEPVRLYAQTRKVSQGIRGEDFATIMLNTDAAVAVLNMSWASGVPPSQRGMPGYLHVRVEGDLGTLELTPDWQLRLDAVSGSEEWIFQRVGQEGYTAMQAHFLDALRTGKEAETSGAQELRTMQLVFGAYHSAAHGTVFDVPLHGTLLA